MSYSKNTNPTEVKLKSVPTNNEDHLSGGPKRGHPEGQVLLNSNNEDQWSSDNTGNQSI